MSSVSIGLDSDVDGQNNAKDIRRFIESSVAEQHYLKTLPDDIKEKVVASLSEGAKGM